MDDKATNPEQIPETIGRYQVQESIGFGAMGAVYKAFDPLIKRTLAIKTIRLDIPRQSPQYKSFIERFQHEARISGTLSHPNIVTLFDIGDENGLPYLAMEFVDGQTVAALIESGHRFKPERVIALASQIASAIDYAHGKGVIHRDIKPSNLILYDEDRVKVTDFGIAKLADAEMTQSGTLLGTPSYMSPEQAMGDKLDGRSDIFSLGVCCFEMLAGEQPFPGTNVTSILYKLVHVDPIEPANLEMHGLVPQKWHEVFGRVLAKRPDDRYQTATAFVQDLEFCLGAWFGALGTEETIATGLERTVVMNAPIVDDTPATVVMKAAALDEAPATVAMPAVAPSDDAATVVMKAGAPLPSPPPPPRPSASAAAKKPAASPVKPAAAPEDDDAATVVLKAGDLQVPPSPVAEEEPPATVVMAAPADEPTVRVQLPQTARMPAPQVDATVTVQVPKPAPTPGPAARAPKPPAAPAARTPPPPPPPPARGLTPPPPPPPKAAPALETPVPVAAGTDGAARSRRSGVPAALVVGGGALALVFGIVVAWLLLRSRGGAPEALPTPSPEIAVAPPSTTLPPPPVPVAPVTGAIKVVSVPPGAMVTVNGQSQGPSPLEVSGLAAGEYEVKVELRGYEAKTQRVAVTAEQPTADLQVALSRLAPTTGTADFVSTPFGAAVTVDGAAAGQTPLLQHRLKPGPHKVELAKEGYETWAGTVTVEAGKKAKVDATLRAVVKATPPPAPVAEVTDANRIYNNVPSEVDSVARRTSGSSPVYPSEAPKLRPGERASVVFTFVVTEEGEVTDLKITESGGSKALDEAVLAAVRKWKFSPAVKKGTKVKVRIAQKQTFLAG